MTIVKIISDPYRKKIEFKEKKNQSDSWVDIPANSKLREIDEETFFPFKVREIVNKIIAEYYVNTERVDILFDGTADEYRELERICDNEEDSAKVIVSRGDNRLQNARDILDYTRKIFEQVHHMIEEIMSDDEEVIHELTKVSEALKNIIPVCVFGNYSSGKSTFINSIIGYEILPSGGDPVTAKIYEIKRSSQNDRASIKFSYLDNAIELAFRDNDFEVKTDSQDSDIIRDIIAALDALETESMVPRISRVLSIINSFEKKNRASTVISNVIQLEVPFNPNGFFGQSRNEYVVFDTPGSNSQTNIDHEKVLTESLKGFSNGIPVWVCQYDAMDSMDNASLCEKLSEIEALDNRFNMIVVNKADSVELPKNGFDQEDIETMMEYEAVDKMYSSGIYFVSSVMGLMAKDMNSEHSEYLEELFEEKEKKFSDPTARSYKKLYEYNVMPEPMKQRAVQESISSQNLIYANSGILCVESEIEQFASCYAAYNKCQMASGFLDAVIQDTKDRIDERTETIELNRKKRQQELDETSRELISNIRDTSNRLIREYERNAKQAVNSFVKRNLNYEIPQEKLDEVESEKTKQYRYEENYSDIVQEEEEARDQRIDNMRAVAQGVLHRDVRDSFTGLREGWLNDTKNIQEKKKSARELETEIDKRVADDVMDYVKENFRKNLSDAQIKLSENSQRCWRENEEQYRMDIIQLIRGNEGLSKQRQEELEEVILNYPSLEYNDEAEKVFEKNRFLRGRFLGVRFSESEKLDNRRLAGKYNRIIHAEITNNAIDINNNCEGAFRDWQKKLAAFLEENITMINPELKELSDIIKEDSRTISKLEREEQAVKDALESLRKMMAWTADE